ncbi:MAG: nucleotidyltransferase domain-containing protein [Elusimicrobiota bacterium]
MGIKNILDEFKAEIKSIYGRKLKKVVLYGSWARGEATKESDIDLVVIFKDKIIPGQEIDRMINIITENSPLLLNVRKEGIAA